MRTLSFIIALVAGVAFQSLGQSKKGDLKLNVSFALLAGSSVTDHEFSGHGGTSVNPSFGYYLSDRTSLDLNFTYTTSEDIRIEDVRSYYHSFAFVPTVRNNIVNKKKFRLFAEAGFGFGTISYRAKEMGLQTFEHQDLSGGVSILNLGIGASYMFNDNFGLEFMLPYSNMVNITSVYSDRIYYGVSPTLGLTYIL